MIFIFLNIISKQQISIDQIINGVKLGTFNLRKQCQVMIPGHGPGAGEFSESVNKICLVTAHLQVGQQCGERREVGAHLTQNNIINA